MLGGSVSRGRGRPAPTKPNKTETEFRKILVGTGRGVRRAEAPPERGCFHFGLFCWRVSSTGVPLTLVFAWLVASFRTGRNGEEKRDSTTLAKASWSRDQSLASRHDPTVAPKDDRIDLSQSWHGVPTRRFPCAPGAFQGGNAINNIPHRPALNGSGLGLGDRHGLTHGLRPAFFRRGMRILLRDRRGWARCLRKVFRRLVWMINCTCCR